MVDVDQRRDDAAPVICVVGVYVSTRPEQVAEHVNLLVDASLHNRCLLRPVCAMVAGRLFTRFPQGGVAPDQADPPSEKKHVVQQVVLWA